MLHPELVSAINSGSDASQLTARTVHGFWTAMMAEQAGRTIDIRNGGPGHIEIHARLAG